jgi:hypothetical protein
VLTRPTYSSLNLGRMPTVASRVGEPINVGMLPAYYQL